MFPFSLFKSKEKICPLIGKACIREQCHAFISYNHVWEDENFKGLDGDEASMMRSKFSGRIEKCRMGVFQSDVFDKEKIEEKEVVRESGIILSGGRDA